MTSLRFLKIYKSSSVGECKINLSQGLESLPESLVYFYWHEHPLKCLPSNFTPENLVELSMPQSQNLAKLKGINLSYSEQLI
ncbi:hypothetical protein L484_002831 [Morus notabilis]|uniref:Uncharacterized protein n=1 Tax=Morus notabilis TaxID=981085 RepID=W9QR76_9ROSA|nr:hypothetical protein L484_002831 [Morus notabilis]